MAFRRERIFQTRKDAAKGRIRHLYIHTGFRRKGIAAAILKDLEKDAVGHFDALTLRTSSREADLFYRALGFRASGQSLGHAPEGARIITGSGGLLPCDTVRL